MKEFLKIFLLAIFSLLMLVQLQAAPRISVVAPFPVPYGTQPLGGVIQAVDGDFYGTTPYGGSAGFGTLYKMTADGSVTTLISFTGPNGSIPQAGLILGKDGNFYGTTFRGGTNDAGTVFRLTAKGTFSTLFSFDTTNGANPRTALLQGLDNSLYGTTFRGGTSNNGTVFKLTLGGTLTTLVNFQASNGAYPQASLVQDAAGNLFGSTTKGGTSNKGTLFKLTPAGVLTTLVSFNGDNGANPQWALVADYRGNGYYYGITPTGGSGGAGTLFKISPTGVLTTLVAFDGDNGFTPKVLFADKDGRVYGVTAGNPDFELNGTFFKTSPSGALTILKTFTNPNETPNALSQAQDGSFYGTTDRGGDYFAGSFVQQKSSGLYTQIFSFGGTSPSSSDTVVPGDDGNFYGFNQGNGVTIYEPDGSSHNVTGRVYRLTPLGALSLVYSFSNTYTTLDGFELKYGSTPQSLLKGSDGNLYLTTSGFNYWDENQDGSATNSVVKLTTAGVASTLTTFNNYYNGPSGPYGPNDLNALTQGKDGNLYGEYEQNYDPGTIFQLTTGGTLSNLCGSDTTVTDLTQGSDDNLYGTNLDGTIFKVTLGGVYTPLYTLTGADGVSPNDLILAANGNLYGSTENSLFQLTPLGVFTTIKTDVANSGPMVQATDGFIYGTSTTGGAYDGYVFKISPTGKFASSVSFIGTNGSNPNSGLFLNSDGTYFGTTALGGAKNTGVIFKLTAP